LDNDNLTLPCEFSFEAGHQDGRFLEILNILIHPCLLPAELSGGGGLNHNTYEYYQPNMMARQLGCGQMPPRLFLHEFLKPREEIKELAQSSRVFSVCMQSNCLHLALHIYNSSSPHLQLLVARIP
jgi:hypothetical protein